MRARLSARAAVLVGGAVVAAGLLIGGSAAFAVPGPPSLTIEANGDDFINATEQAAVIVNGTAPAAANLVAVRIVGDAACDVAAANQTAQQNVVPVAGAWTATFDVSAFTEGVTLCARARASDDAGSTYGGIGISSNTPALDRVVLPGTLSLDDPNSDGFLNLAEATAGIPVSWTANAASDATASQVRFADASGTTPSANCGPEPATITGAASGTSTLSPACAADLNEGDLVTLRGVWTDLAGNVSAEGISNALTKDTLVPAAPSVNVVPDPISASSAANVQVSGTSELETTVSIALTDGTSTIARTAITDELGNYATTIDAGSLLDCSYPGGIVNSGPITDAERCIAANVAALDLASNPSATATGRAFKDAAAPAAPAVTVAPGTISEPQKQNVEISVNGEGLSVANVRIVDSDPATADLTRTFTVDGEVTVFSDLSSLTDGNISVTTTLTDAVGNVSAQTITNVVKNLTTTSVLMTSPAAGSLDDENVTFAGTAAPGQTVTVYESKNGTQSVLGNATADGTGKWSLSYFFTDKVSKSHTVFARTANGLGSAYTTFDVDTVRPVSTITEPVALKVYQPGEAIHFAGQASDDFARSGVKSVDAFLYDTFGHAIDHRDAVCAGCNTVSATWTFDTTGLSAGHYILRVFAVDGVGHRQTTPAEVNILVL